MIFSFTRKSIRKKPDEDLIAEYISSGDLEMLGELYSRYMHLVYGVSLKYLKDRDDAMDAVMQIFEKLINEIKKQNIVHFSNWLHIVTKNYCLMQIRSHKSIDKKHREWINDNVLFMEIDAPLHPIDEMEPDLEDSLRDCVERLKNGQKECIKMFYFDNKCYNEIAADLCLDERKVKSYLQNGKRNLKLCLEEKNERKTEQI